MFSQNQEESAVLRYFGNRKVCVLSMGENNGTHLSNVKQILLNGSYGVLVEPAPLVFKQLQDLYKDRKDVTCLQYAVSDFNGITVFYDSGTHLNQGDTSLLSSLSKDEIKKWEPTTEYDEIKVEVVDFNRLFELSPYKEFQLISCDCEGSDLTIISQIDFTALKTEMLIVEWNGKNKELFDNIVAPHGFYLLSSNSENLLYAR